MAVINVEREDTLGIQRLKINNISNNVGDLDQLNPEFTTNSAENLVEVANYLNTKISADYRLLLARAIALG